MMIEDGRTMPGDSFCDYCDDTGIEPCDNCGETDDHTCHLDGEEYGPSECRRRCTPLEVTEDE